MKAKLLSLFILFILCLSTVFAQSSFQILLKEGTTIPDENINTFDEEIKSAEQINGHFYRLLQFKGIPTIEEHEAIAHHGIQLLEYIPHLTYIAAIPSNLDLSVLSDLNVRTILPIEKQLKIDQNLIERPFADWAIHGNKIGIHLQYHKNLSEADLKNRFEADGIRLMMSNGINNFIYAHIDESEIETIAALPYVAYIALESEPGKKEDVEGRSLHRASAIDTSFPGGRQYTGEGVKVMVRDDGRIGPHIDYQGRMTLNPTNDNGDHGDGVGGIMCGAGNLDPRNRGMAAGAELYVLNYNATFLDQTLPLHMNENVLVTNSSYSDGCNGGYTGITATVDQQMNDFPTFLHVFSAGNSNNNECGYGAGNQWGNITGGHKQGKNVIATANVFSDGSIVNSSSRGPAHDGRIKPDIAANGQNQISTDPNNAYAPFGGTSGAAPGIAGITAQLHQAYSDLNGGDTAEGALLKAIMLNSANDYGNVGPDFIFGWGIVNAYRAALTIEENRFLAGTVDPNGTQTHTIDIPEGVSQVKVMTYWRERESNLFTTKSLINNIDTRLVKDGDTFLPWILDPSPNPTTLDLPATKGIDDLNNVEQVAIENPVAGTYTLEVVGTELPFGAHDYFVVYEFITPTPTLIYPIGGEALVPGETERIHWDAYGNGGSFTLVYSLDGGNSWLQIAQVPGSDRMYDWSVPDEFTSNAMVMVVRGGETDMSDATFSIAPMPVLLEVVGACDDVITLEWVGIDEAIAYEVFLLGEKYMEPIGTSASTTFDYTSPDIFAEHWFAVRALGPDNEVSRRTNAINYSGGLINCVFPEISISASATEVCLLESINFFSTSTEVALDYSWSFVAAFPPVSTLEDPVNITFAQVGTFNVMVTATNDLGSTTETIEVTVLPLPDADFEFEATGTTVDFESLAVGDAIYNWNFGDGNGSTSGTPNHTYAEPGTYTVTLTVFNLCGSVTTTQQVTVITTSTEDRELTFDMVVAPNPSFGDFEMRINSAQTVALDWDLYNLQGQILRNGQLVATNGGTEQNIRVSNVPAGVYLMKVTSEKGFKTTKVIVQ